jgi:xanthine dehydrogenase small subunit
MTSFILNGSSRHLNAPPGRTVLDYLRLEARLTGTKEGCAEGDCGACTVAIGRKAGDGLKFTAVNSCIMLASDLDGCVVVTSEGVARDGVLAPVQAAMVELHGSQCGFCTPGFVMSLYALGAAACREDVLDALAGNLCRCTGYRPIVAAADAITPAPDSRIPEWRAGLDALPPGDAPRTLEALDALLAVQPGAKLTAGTTDIGVGIAKYGQVPAGMVSVAFVPELKTIIEHANLLEIGAAATYSEILPYLQAHFPNFAKLIRRIGSLQIRNLGTMGGNVCNASPIGDSAPCLIALGAGLCLRSAAGEREIPIDEFFTAYRQTQIKPGEYLKSIRIPYLAANQSFHAYKLAKRYDQDISAVAAGFRVTVEAGVITGARVGFGGMAATPLRAAAIEAALIGQPCTDAAFEAAAGQVAGVFQPISDFRASAGYRLDGAAGFLRRLGAELQSQPADIWAL